MTQYRVLIESLAAAERKATEADGALRAAEAAKAEADAQRREALSVLKDFNERQVMAINGSALAT